MPYREPFKCPHCGEMHNGVPDLAFLRPDPLLTLSEHHRARCYETDDACAIPSIDGSEPRFFLRGVLLVPITTTRTGRPVDDRQRSEFGFGPWAEVEQSDYETLVEADDGVVIPPFLGMLATAIPSVPESFGAAIAIDPGDNTKRPLFRATEPRSPIAQLQRGGVPYVRAMALVHGINPD